MSKIGSAVTIYAYMTDQKRLRNLKYYDRKASMDDIIVYDPDGVWINFPDVTKKSHMAWKRIR